MFRIKECLQRPDAVQLSGKILDAEQRPNMPSSRARKRRTDQEQASSRRLLAPVSADAIVTVRARRVHSWLPRQKIEDGLLVLAVADRLHVVAPRYLEGLRPRNEAGERRSAAPHVVVAADRDQHGN